MVNMLEEVKWKFVSGLVNFLSGYDKAVRRGKIYEFWASLMRGVACQCAEMPPRSSY